MFLFCIQINPNAGIEDEEEEKEDDSDSSSSDEESTTEGTAEPTWNDKLTSFQKLVAIKAFKEEKASHLLC